jgi:hypothetical protein
MTEIEFKEKILECLKNHPEGLTIVSIAKDTGINRITVSKYLLVMTAEGHISQRMVGTAKLCWNNSVEKEFCPKEKILA